jgi:hypothetical protein
MTQNQHTNETDEPNIDADDERLLFIAPNQRRSDLRIHVSAQESLELCTLNLRDVVYECQNTVVELLANLISRADSGRVVIEEYSCIGMSLIRKIFEAREQQVLPNLCIEFKVQTRQQVEGLSMTLMFIVRLADKIFSVLDSNEGAHLYVQ